MFNRKFNLLAIALILLSPTLAYAGDLDSSRSLSVGQIEINTDPDGGINVQTPKIKINTNNTNFARQVNISRHRQRYRSKYKLNNLRRPQYPRYNPPPAIDHDSRVFNRTTIIRDRDGVTESRTEQHSVQCSGGSVISTQQSTQVINGRGTTRSQVYTNCN